MNIFLPHEIAELWILIAFITPELVLGYLLAKWKNLLFSRFLSWTLVVSLVLGIHWLTLSEPAGYRMLAIINVLFVGMKVVVANEYFLRKKTFPFLEWIAYSVAWVGMNPLLFEQPKQQDSNGGMKLILFGVSRIGLGIILMYCAYLIANTEIFTNLYFQQIVASLSVLVGISLFLHFGLLNLNAGAWKLLGVPAYPVFRFPLKSRTLTEFWGKRWNIAFSEMAAIAVYKPLKQKIGMGKAKAVAFIFSGVLHELALSVPIGRGYGLPTLYFLMHALAIQMETRMKIQNRFFQHFWVMIWLLLPMGLLFHPYFMQEVIWPFLNPDWMDKF